MTAIRVTFFIAFAAGLLSGCGTIVKPIDKAYDSPREIPAGPGLFSGKDGEFKIDLHP